MWNSRVWPFAALISLIGRREMTADSSEKQTNPQLLLELQVFDAEG
jgi:hypothetical protein